MKNGKRSGRLTRRKFVVGSGILATGLTGVGLWIARSQQWIGEGTGGLGRPGLPHAASTGRVKEYVFEAAPVRLELGGKQVNTWAYNGKIPGPEIRLTEGDTLRVRLKNQLEQETTIHWHGIPLPNAMDGVPDYTQPPIKKGEEFVYEFVVPVAGTYFYHPHVGLQLDRGLYGPLIVEPTKETLNYDQEAVLMLDDWLDGIQGTPEEAKAQLIAGGDRMHGMDMGNMENPVPPDLIYPLYLVNGKTSDNPMVVEVKQGQRLRLRLINAASATIFRVAVGGHRMRVTHSDGQMIEPIEVDALRIGMGERYDVLIATDRPGLWQIAAQVEGAEPMVRAILKYRESSAPPPLANEKPAELGGRLLTTEMLKAASGLTTPLEGQPDQTIALQLSGGMGEYIWKINNQVFPQIQPITVKKQTLIRFQFINQSMMPHPMHLHGHFFQVENGSGRGPLKDTVLVDPMQQLNVIWVADNLGQWAMHCHQVYHQETGMMQIVRVE